MPIEFHDHEADIIRGLLTSLNPYKKYEGNPVLFAKEVLGIELWDKQAEILTALCRPPHRVLVKSAHAVGKTLMAAVFALYVYLIYDPSETIITAAREESLKDTLFKELRNLYGNKPGWYPRSNRIDTTAGHYIKGTVAKSGDAFQGIHGDVIAIILDEATAVPAEIFEAAKGMLAGGEKTFFLVIFNPTDNSSQVFIEEQSGDWDVFSISSFEHPNIIAELEGKKAPIPGAVRLRALKQNMSAWGSWVKEDDRKLSDIVFEEPGEPVKYWRPSGEGESRILGRWPSVSSESIFGESDFEIALSYRDECSALWKELQERARTETQNAGSPNRFGSDLVIKGGCDVARFGNDRTTITFRIGKMVIHHEWHTGQDTNWTTGRLKQLCNEFGNLLGIVPQNIRVNIDDTGIGGAVTDQRDGYNFQPVNAANIAIEDMLYPNKRSEMLFNLALMIREGSVRFHPNVDDRTVEEIKREALSVRYRPDSRGRRQAEQKDSIRERLKKSPDNIDSLALAFYGPSGFDEPSPIVIERQDLIRDTRQLFGTVNGR